MIDPLQESERRASRRRPLHLAACLGVLSDCDPAVSSRQNPWPHPQDICSRLQPFARALERDLASAAAVATSDRPIGDSITRFPVTVSVTELRLDHPTIIGDDGKAVECSARWRAIATVAPVRPSRSIVEKDLLKLVDGDRPSFRSTDVAAGGELVQVQERRSTQALRTVRHSIAGSSGGFRALWEPPRIWVYGDLGVPVRDVIPSLLGPKVLVASKTYCIRSSGQRVSCPATITSHIEAGGLRPKHIGRPG